MADWSREVRFACRRLRSAPAFTLFSIVTLALAHRQLLEASARHAPAVKQPARFEE